MPDRTARLNWINIALMVIACAASIVAPFHVFLFAYAVVGPLHYLTEISWLHDRKFFTPRPRPRQTWLLLVGGTTIVMAVGFVSSDLLNRPISPALEIGMFLLVFLAAGIASYVAHPVNAIALIGVAMLVLFVFSKYPTYGIAAYLLMTIIHVFVFTGLFIVAGASKSNSTSGYLSFVAFLACAAIALIAPASQHGPTDSVRSIYSTFEQLNLLLLRIGHAGSGDVYAASATGIMRFISFAYLYHYLNWFSKTSIIRWHEVSRTRGIGIVTGWLAGVALYLYSYRVGFAVLYLLSVVHVMLEFPLNHQTIVGLVRVAMPKASPQVARGGFVRT